MGIFVLTDIQYMLCQILPILIIDVILAICIITVYAPRVTENSA